MINSVADIKGMFFCLYSRHHDYFEMYKIISVNEKNYTLLGLLTNPSITPYKNDNRISFIEMDIEKVNIFPTDNEALEFCQYAKDKDLERQGKSTEDKKEELIKILDLLRR